MPKKVESDRVGEAVAHSFCSLARKKNGTRLFGREVNFLSIVFPFLEPRRGVKKRNLIDSAFYLNVL